LKLVTLSEPGCLRNQYQSCPGGNEPSGSRRAFAGEHETFRGDSYGDDPHNAKIHDPNHKQYRCQVCACE
jgi:hypothetical protein